MNPFKSAKIIGENIDPAVYIRQEANRGDKDYIMSRGELMEFAQCPHRWINGYRDGESKSTEWGELIDCLVLQPESFARRFAVAPTVYPCEPTKADPRKEKPWNLNSTHCKEWQASAEKNGFTVIKSEKKAEADTALKTLMADEHLAELISCSRKQVFVMAEYFDEETGFTIAVKALLDLVPDQNHRRFGKTLADFKTSLTANPEAWPKLCYQHHYHVQAALYLDAYVKATGEDRVDWLHAIQENFPPYETCGSHIAGDLVDLGRFAYVQALRNYTQCLASNYWPRYSERPGNIIEGFPTANVQDWMIKPEKVWRPLPELKPITTRLVDLDLTRAN